MSFNRWLIFVFSLITFPVANAHNVWVEKTIQTTTPSHVVKFGHDKPEPYPEHKLKAVKLLDANGQISSVNYKYLNGEAYFDAANASLVFLKFDNGIWSKLPNGKSVEKTKKEVPDAISSVELVKFGKSILVWDEQAFKPHQMEYELIPQAKPESGKPLDILVLHTGTPVKGVKISTDENRPFVLTDEKGIAQYMPKTGTNQIWAGFAEKNLNHPDYSERSIEYLLTFDVQGEK